MRLMMNGINGHYLQYILDNCKESTEDVVAAVAYATEVSLLFDWCWKNNKSLTYYGRLDEDVAVSSPVLESFLKRKSPNYVCYLVQHHHAKVIWWRGVGVYIGSANITNKAWYSNVEVGCFFSEDEINDEMAGDLSNLFSLLHSKATPLTDELFELLKKRERECYKNRPDPDGFWKNRCINKWGGLVHASHKNASDKRRDDFLVEWYSTLQIMRDIGSRIGTDENRPIWVNKDVPSGAQADQFLHAHYYQRTFEGTSARYGYYFEQNKKRKEDALTEAIQWWKALSNAPATEAEMLNTNAPLLRNLLSQNNVKDMNYESFTEICSKVFAIRDYARRVHNNYVDLPSGVTYTIPQKVEALSKKIWNAKSIGGLNINEVIQYVLYEGTLETLPERIWDVVSDQKWKIPGLGISAFGEMVGWALPDIFPPRNGRTSKALKSLGYDVVIHV